MNTGAPREGRRRALHLASGTIGLAACCLGLPHRTLSLVLVVLLLSAAALEAARRHAPALQALLVRLSAGAMRPAEERGITGASLLLTGYAATWWLFPAAAAIPAILVTAAADPAAAAVGTFVARSSGRKTLAGSASALLVALAVLALAGVAWRIAVAGALAASLAERVPGRGADNLSMPLATAAILTLLT